MSVKGHVSSELMRQGQILDLLPIPACVIAMDGSVVRFNALFSELLGLDPSITPNIADWYVRRDERETLLAECLHNPSDTQQTILELSTPGGSRIVSEHFRVIRSDGAPVGFFSCMVDATDQSHLLDSLPIGIYTVDAHDRLRTLNTAVAEMLGYSDKSVLTGRRVDEFYVDPSAAANFRDSLEHLGTVRNFKADLRRQNGQRIPVAIYSRVVRDRCNAYSGRLGAIIDLTTEERYTAMLQHLPLGLFEVEVIDDADILARCNDECARILGYESASQVIGRDTRTFHASEAAYRQFVESRRRAHDANQPLDLQLRIGLPDGRERIAVLRSSTDSSLVPKRRYGILRDISKQERQQEEFSLKLSTVLHNFGSVLSGISLQFKEAAACLGPSAVPPHAYLEQNTTSQLLKQRAAVLERELRVVLLALGDAATIPQLDILRTQLKVLEGYSSLDVHPDSHASILRSCASLAESGVREAGRGRLARSQLRPAMQAAHDLVHLCGLIGLFQTTAGLTELDSQMRSVREFLAEGSAAPTGPSRVRLRELVQEASDALAPYRQSRRIRVVLTDNSRDSYVLVDRQSIQRAISNVIHNAIKYSWNRGGDRPPWIDIVLSASSGAVRVDIENRGVPIPRDEMPLVFDLCFRGRLSKDRGRPGTGIGLYDAAQAVQRSGGDISLSSTPASPDHHAEDYTVPFLTQVSITLPRFA